MSEIKDIRQRMADKKKFIPAADCPFPKNMLIELTNACNHKCLFCANRKMIRKAGVIEEKLVYRILEEAYALGAREVGFQTVGEPFIAKKLEDFISRAKGIGFEYTYISTNGALPGTERIRAVIEAGLDSIKFSVNAGTAKTYEQIHGADDFKKVLRNISYISDYRKKFSRPKRIYVSYVVTRQNLNECDLLKEAIGRQVDDIIFIHVGNQGGMMNEAQECLEAENKVRPSRKPPCSILFNRLHITHEGYLTACCVDYQNYLVMADLNRVSLKEAWEEGAAREFRKRHIEGKIEHTLCYNCLCNKNERIEPLIPELAAIYDSDSFTLKEDINARI